MMLLLDVVAVADQTAALGAALAVVLIALLVGVTGMAVLHPDLNRREEARDVLRILLALRDG